MMASEQILDEETVAWGPMEESGPGNYRKRLANGLDGGIQVHIVTMPEGSKIKPHFHDVSQYQVILEGSAKFPEHNVNAFGLHYTDAYRPYGPILPGPGFKMAVLRRKKGGIVRSPYSPEGRKFVDPKARARYGQSNEVQWENVKGKYGSFRRKKLLADRSGDTPKGELIEVPPNSSFLAESAPYGEFHILVAGSAMSGHSEIKPYTMRYVAGSETPRALKSGSEGATWLICGFDRPLP